MGCGSWPPLCNSQRSCGASEGFSAEKGYGQIYNLRNLSDYALGSGWEGQPGWKAIVAVEVKT